MIVNYLIIFIVKTPVGKKFHSLAFSFLLFVAIIIAAFYKGITLAGFFRKFKDLYIHIYPAYLTLYLLLISDKKRGVLLEKLIHVLKEAAL